MIVIKQKLIMRADLQANPNVLYIFGDNLDRQGMGGQAKEMRGEPNAFGIATKRSISHSYPNDYFFDNQADVLDILAQEFEYLRLKLRVNKYNALVLPLDGIGTGLAKLPEFAPEALNYINLHLKHLETL